MEELNNLLATKIPNDADVRMHFLWESHFSNNLEQKYLPDENL